MAKKPPPEGQKPAWFGKRCTRCEEAINYAYKGIIVGWCGKCTDELRNHFIKEHEKRKPAKETRRVLIEKSTPKVIWFVFGALFAILVVLIWNLFAAESFAALISSLRALFGR